MSLDPKCDTVTGHVTRSLVWHCDTEWIPWNQWCWHHPIETPSISLHACAVSCPLRATPGCFTEPRHDCMLWRQLSNQFELQFFQKISGCRQWQWRSAVVVMRPDKMWNKVPYCPLRLRSYWPYMVPATEHKFWPTFLYRHNWLSTWPPVNSASSPLFMDSQISS